MEKFNDIINSGVPVLVDFYAVWCAPCKAISPIIQQVASDVHGKARVLKIDVDKNPQLAALHQIRAVPTLAIFKNGSIVWRHSGGIDKQSLYQKLLSFV